MSPAPDDVRVYRFEGDFGSHNMWEVQADIDGLIEDGATKLVLNIGRMMFINSSALGYLIKTWKELSPKGGTLVFSEPTEFMSRTLSVLGLDTVIATYPDDAAALAALGAE